MNLKSSIARKLLIASYACEIFEAQALIRQGGVIEMPAGLLFVVGAAGPMIMAILGELFGQGNKDKSA